MIIFGDNTRSNTSADRLVELSRAFISLLQFNNDTGRFEKIKGTPSCFRVRSWFKEDAIHIVAPLISDSPEAVSIEVGASDLRGSDLHGFPPSISDDS